MAQKRASYTAEFKLKIVKFAEETSNRKAARTFKVDEKCVRQWRESKSILEAMPNRKRAMRGRQAFWPELEEDMRQWVMTSKNNDVQLTENDIRLKACELAREKGIEKFKGGKNWCTKFMQRNGFAKQSKSNNDNENHQDMDYQSSHSSSIPDWEEKLSAIHTLICRIISSGEPFKK